jgi:hypothetical protein
MLYLNGHRFIQKTYDTFEIQNQMHYVPHTYPYPYYSNVHTLDTRSNNEPTFHQKVVSESLLERIKEKTSAIDLYSRLVQFATDLQQIDPIRPVLEDEQAHSQRYLQENGTTLPT